MLLDSLMEIAYGFKLSNDPTKETVICDARTKIFAVSLFISLHNTLITILFPFTHLQDIGIFIQPRVTLSFCVCINVCEYTLHRINLCEQRKYIL